MADLTDDWREFLSLLISHRVKFVIVGGHAVSAHGRPRVTGDLDVFVEASETNARRLRRVLVEFGFGDDAPDERVLARKGKVFMIGVPPFRIDVLTSISGVGFATAWRDRVRLPLEMGRLPFISRAHLIRNKRASGRAKDLADLDVLMSSRSSRPARRSPK